MSEVTSANVQQSDTVNKTYEAITQVVLPRFYAFLIDGVIYTLLLGGLASLIGIPHSYQNGVIWLPTWTWPFVQLPSFQGTKISLLWAYLTLISYYFVQEWLFGTTIGKRAVGLYVVDLNGNRMRWWQAFVRNITRPIDYGFVFIGFFLVRFDHFHQRIGDRWAGTLVVSRSSLSALPVSRDEMRRGLRILALSAIPLIVCYFAFAYYLSPPLIIAGLFDTKQNVFSSTIAPARSGQQLSTCVTGYMLGTPTKGTEQGVEAVTYPVTYEISGNSQPNQTGSITLLWHGFFGGGWTTGLGTGPNCTQ